MLVGTLAFAFSLMRRVENNFVPNIGVSRGRRPPDREPARVPRLPRPLPASAATGGGGGARPRVLPAQLRLRGRPRQPPRGLRRRARCGARGSRRSPCAARGREPSRRSTPTSLVELGAKTRLPGRSASRHRGLRALGRHADRCLRRSGRTALAPSDASPTWWRSATSGRSSRTPPSPSASSSTSPTSRSRPRSTTRRRRCRCSTTSGRPSASWAPPSCRSAPGRATVGRPHRGVVIPARSWEDYLTLTVNEIREYGHGRDPDHAPAAGDARGVA